MKLNSMRIERQPRLMIIPMIDIIFFLLVFFMISTMYMVEQRSISVNLPQSQTANVNMTKPGIITLTKEGKIYFNKEEIAPELLAKRVKIELAQNSEQAFLVRADKQVEYGKVMYIFDELKLQGVKRIGVAADAK